MFVLRLIALATLALSLIALGGCADGGEPRVSVHGATETLRPVGEVPEGSGAAEIIAARNEAESVQVAIENAGAEVDVTLAGPLRGPGGRIEADSVTIYRAGPYEVGADNGPASDLEGGDGPWFDPLIPAVDQIYGEQRAAFPVDAEGGTVVALIDVFADPEREPGLYEGLIEVSDEAGMLAEIPLQVEIADAEIPSTSSLRSSVPMPADAPCEAHLGSSCDAGEEAAWLLHSLYGRTALQNRVSLSYNFPLARSESPADSAEMFERWIGPLLEGDALLPGEGILSPLLEDASLTSVNAFWQCVEESDDCLPGWRELASDLDFADRFYLYVCDEPFDDPADWEVCNERLSEAESVAPGLAGLITATADNLDRFGGSEAFADTEILAPSIFEVADRKGELAGSQRPSYEPFLSEDGNEFWIYTSCVSHGCSGDGEDPYFEGWASYVIDQPGSQARAMGWLAEIYDASGELYFEAGRALPRAWENQFDFTGHGDGTLFYPGLVGGSETAPAIGGEHDIPIESLRLKRIRDGHEDYELLQLASDADSGGARQVAERLIAGPDEATFSADFTPEQLREARCELFDLAGGRPELCG